uniref:LPP20 lipoprotein n=1 Tax=Desulfacinum infernum TaxID=35837 RepID=A0A832EJE9_9BACT
MRRRFGAPCAFLLIWTVFCLLGTAKPGGAQGASQTFVAQGTVPLQPANRAQSRSQALEDLLRQAVLQALGTFVPGQVLAQKNKEIRKDILTQSERYAKSFKILGEYVDGDLYRIQGAVDVAMEALRSDAAKLGLVAAGPVSQGEAPSGPRPAASASKEEPQPASAPTAQPSSERNAAEAASVKRVLWAVAENWEGSWRLGAGENASAQGSLGEWAVQEASDYAWRLDLLSASTVLKAPPWDEESQKQLIDQARRQGQSHVVFGTARRAGNVLELRLKVVDAASGRVLSVSEDRVGAPEAELSEGLITLAAVAVSKVDTALSGALAPSPPQPAQPSGPSGAPSALPSGAWHIAVKGDASYAAWLSMEKKLSETSKAFTVDSVVLETEAVVVRANNVDPDKVTGLDGMRVGLNLVLRLEGIDPAARKITMTVVPATAEPEVPKERESKTP